MTEQQHCFSPPASNAASELANASVAEEKKSMCVKEKINNTATSVSLIGNNYYPTEADHGEEAKNAMYCLFSRSLLTDVLFVH